MIAAAAQAEALIARLRARGAKLAGLHGEHMARERAARRSDWRSARSLWPGFGRE